MRPYPSLTDSVAPSAPNYQPVPVNSSEDQWKRRPMNGFGKRLPEKRLRAKSVTYVSGTDREKMVGERGFEPPTPWSRTRCSTRLSHSPTLCSRRWRNRGRPSQKTSGFLVDYNTHRHTSVPAFATGGAVLQNPWLSETWGYGYDRLLSDGWSIEKVRQNSTSGSHIVSSP
jgi:hypothetical protein